MNHRPLRFPIQRLHQPISAVTAAPPAVEGRSAQIAAKNSARSSPKGLHSLDLIFEYQTPTRVPIRILLIKGLSHAL